MKKVRKLFSGLLLAILVSIVVISCSSTKPIRTEAMVDLERFMGDWYVIAHIPTFLEDNAYNAVETYELREDDVVNTTFTFREGGFDGEEKVYTPTGFVNTDQGNAVWGMRFFWPFRSEYRIAYLDRYYRYTIIARSKRDYVWIMARQPQLSDNDYQTLVGKVADLGYDMSELRRVPQRWPVKSVSQNQVDQGSR